jgi:hypothetical protein
MARNRITYASQSVWANGNVLYRVQSLGSTTTFTSEDIFELGHLDIIDVVDDVPAVAVTLNTNDFGDVRTLAILAQVPPAKAAMSATADSATGNLVSGGTYLHGVSLADFAIVCGNLPGISLWAPVQAECDFGTLANNIDQTLFLDEVFVNSIEFSYTTGANATENYAAETDNKMWLLNAGAYVNYEEPTVTNGMTSFTLASGVAIPILSTGKAAFLRKTTGGAPAVTVYDEGTNTMMNYQITASGSAAWNAAASPAATLFWYDSAELDGTLDGPYTVNVPTNLTLTTSDRIEVVYAADGYTGTTNKYFELYAGEANSDVGALRQGQTEIYIVDGSSGSAAWRLTGVTISADLTREPLTELGHLGPYDRPLVTPIPITVTVDTTAGDLENWAKFAGQLTEFNANTLDDIDLSDLMNKDDLSLVVKVYEQTDEEAGGTGADRVVNTSSLVGDQQFLDGALQSAYSLGGTEYALKTVVVKNLKITDEGMTLDVGANATQTFGFRSNNDLFMVKGDLTFAKVADLARNSS